MQKRFYKVVAIDLAACIRALALLLFVVLNAPAVSLLLRWLSSNP